MSAFPYKLLSFQFFFYITGLCFLCRSKIRTVLNIMGQFRAWNIYGELRVLEVSSKATAPTVLALCQIQLSSSSATRKLPSKISPCVFLFLNFWSPICFLVCLTLWEFYVVHVVYFFGDEFSTFKKFSVLHSLLKL